jgi:glycosyltransferase involved in cell wall biosynthesis
MVTPCMKSPQKVESKKVLHIISGDIWAGAEAQVFNTLSSLRQTQDYHLACILFNPGVLKERLEKMEINTLVLDETVSTNFRLLLSLYKMIDTIKPDIIHVHRVKEHLLSNIAKRMLYKSIPIVRTVHGGSAASRRAPFRQFLKSTAAIMIDRFIMKYFTDGLVVVSKDLEKSFIGLKGRGKLYRIYNSIDMEEGIVRFNKEEIRNQYGANDLFWIGTAARLVDVKNIPMLIKAGAYLAERHIPFKISIFGDGPLKNELTELIKKTDLSGKIELEGFVPEITPILNSLDVFVLSSFNEGIPISLLEAMRGNTPVVCSRVGGMAEIIDHGVSGLLVPVNDSKKLAEAIIKIYEDPHYAGTLARNAHKMLEEKLSSSKTAEQLGSIYSQLISDARR